ncbi:hypothetical protein [Halorussus amylolyticus]|uniref:hypothetical protein n=1 Tax=Halorussus amylolyticus TaxID=1126242 RepID=UPI00192F3345|nr:hypothetical protein [Halorussus amylolyticus]
MSQQPQQSTGSTGQQTYGGQSQQQPQGQMSQQQPQMGQSGQQQPQSMGQGMQGQQSGGQGQQFGGQMKSQQGGVQTGSAHQTTHQKVGQQFESELTPELNESLEAFDRVVEIASWCADKCIESGPQMAECARLCDDLAELAELNEKLIARDSINGPEVAETFLRVAQHGLPILQQHQQSPHVQETLQAVTYAVDSTNKLLSSISGQQQGMQGIQEMTQQSQGQQSQQPQGQTGQQSQQPQGQQFQPQSQGSQTSY